MDLAARWKTEGPLHLCRHGWITILFITHTYHLTRE